MSEIRDVVEVNIVTEGAKVTQRGFGLALILSHSVAWAERTREYASLTDLVADGFTTSSPEYLLASKLLASDVPPPSFLVGRAANVPTQRFAVTPVAVNNHTYKMKVNGVEVSFTSDGTALASEIIAGLKAAIDLLSLAVTTSAQTTYLRVLADNAGAFFSLESSDPNLRIKQDHVDPGVAADLAAIKLERDDWYWLLTAFNSQAFVEAAATWIQTERKRYINDTEDGNVPNTTESGTDDIGEALKSASRGRSPVVFSKATADFPAAALVGVIAPKNPGRWTAKFKTLNGVTVGAYTSTQRTNMRTKRVNFYETTGGRGSFEEGIAPDGQFIDYGVYRDYLTSRLEERVYGLLAALDKVPQDAGGIALVEAQVRAQLKADSEGADRALIPEGEEGGWTVIAPKLSDISSADRIARYLNAIKFTATYVGAWHKVKIEGTLALG